MLVFIRPAQLRIRRPEERRVADKRGKGKTESARARLENGKCAFSSLQSASVRSEGGFLSSVPSVCRGVLLISSRRLGHMPCEPGTGVLTFSLCSHSALAFLLQDVMAPRL